MEKHKHIMNIEKAKLICEEKFKEYFPKVDIEQTTFIIYEWRDKTFKIELRHGYDYNHYKVNLNYGKLKKITVSKELDQIQQKLLFDKYFFNNEGKLSPKIKMEDSEIRDFIKQINGEILFEGKINNGN